MVGVEEVFFCEASILRIVGHLNIRVAVFYCMNPLPNGSKLAFRLLAGICLADGCHHQHQLQMAALAFGCYFLQRCLVGLPCCAVGQQVLIDTLWQEVIGVAQFRTESRSPSQ